MDRPVILFRYRAALIFFIGALVVSGLTAFPLLAELRVLCSLLGISGSAEPESFTGLRFWIATVYSGLERTYAVYPWVAYGTDWLAFAHIVIAGFFVGPLMYPARNRWVLQAGIMACLLVIPMALVAGSVRGIPLYWRLIDCSFGVFGLLPLLYCLRLSRSLTDD